LSFVATVLVAAPSSIAEQAETAGPMFATAPTSKADASIFADGFETGDTSLWSNGTVANGCKTILMMPTELAD